MKMEQWIQKYMGDERLASLRKVIRGKDFNLYVWRSLILLIV